MKTENESADNVLYLVLLEIVSKSPQALGTLGELFSLILIYDIFICACKIERRRGGARQLLVFVAIATAAVVIVSIMDLMIIPILKKLNHRIEVCAWAWAV